MDDVRWFAPNRFCTLVVPRLRDRGLVIALDGDRPARLAIAMDAQVAAEACRYAARHRCPLIHYVWDLPPWWLGRGRHDWVWLVAGGGLWVPPPGVGFLGRGGVFQPPACLRGACGGGLGARGAAGGKRAGAGR